MSNFRRAVRIAIGYRWTLAATIGCALMVAVLWGANIGTVYPFVEVAFKGQSLQTWVDKSIEDSRELIGELERKIDTLEDAADAESERERSLAQARLEAERVALERYRAVRPAIYRFLPDDPFLTLVVLVGFLLVGTVAKGLFIFAGVFFVERLAHLTALDLRKRFYRRTLRLDVAAFNDQRTADLISRFTHDLGNVSAGIQALFGKAVREPLKMVACLVGAAWINWRLLVLSLVVAPIAALLISKVSRILKRANRKAMEEMSQMYGILDESYQGIKAVKAFTMERYERRRFHQNAKAYFRKMMRIAKYDALVRPMTEVMGIITISLALMAGAYLVINQETHLFGIRMSYRPLSLSSLLVFYGLLAGISDPFRKMSEVFARVQRGVAAADRVFAVMDREPTVRDPEAPKPLPRHRRELSFENISFAYTPAQPVLKNIDLTIPCGETIAIVGPNGCGKSTLLNLVPRFFDPCEGVVRLDGTDLREVRMRELRQQIGLVTQETLLFDDTVYNNIRYGSPHATREEVLRASEQAAAHKFITDRLEHGYETLVGQHGGLLSGGQRQRISLARAILRDPSILLLDEATSQIDLESEQVIHRVLERFIKDRTTIIITHRMSTLALADRIVVLDGGQILDIGTHDELVRRCPLYSRLYEIQFQEIA